MTETAAFALFAFACLAAFVAARVLDEQERDRGGRPSLPSDPPAR